MTGRIDARGVSVGLACLDDLEVQSLIEGTVAPDRIAELVAHVDICRECRELIEALVAGSGVPSERELAAPISQVAAPLVGSEIQGGSYRIDALLAEGGMGRIYRATDLALGRIVAVKVPRSRARWCIRRFEREVAITARLCHPGIVPIHGAGQLGDGTPFYVMQNIVGARLDLALQRSGRQQRLALLHHLVAVANTMAFAHGEGVAHRDLKPQNVMIGRFGETFIIDWGLAKELEPEPAAAADPPARSGAMSAVSTVQRSGVTGSRSILGVLAARTTQPGDVLGTPAFMSPEQARGETVDERSDVFAIGAMLEQLLTGQLPRKAAAAALAHASPELVAICSRAMAPEPSARYRDCGELAAALRTATQHRSATTTTTVSGAWGIRKTIAVATGVGAALGVTISHLASS